MQLQLHYITQHYTTLVAPHHSYNCNCTTLSILHHNYNSTTVHYNYNYICTTQHYIQQLWWGDHCNHCNHFKKHNSNHLSVHQWIRSTIHASQQRTSPIGFLFLNLPPPPCAALLARILHMTWLLIKVKNAISFAVALHLGETLSNKGLENDFPLDMGKLTRSTWSLGGIVDELRCPLENHSNWKSSLFVQASNKLGVQFPRKKGVTQCYVWVLQGGAVAWPLDVGGAAPWRGIQARPRGVFLRIWDHCLCRILALFSKQFGESNIWVSNTFQGWVVKFGVFFFGISHVHFGSNWWTNSWKQIAND